MASVTSVSSSLNHFICGCLRCFCRFRRFRHSRDECRFREARPVANHRFGEPWV